MEVANAADEQRSTGANMTLVAIICFLFFIFESFCLYFLPYLGSPRVLALRLGLAAIGGFWLACGRPRLEIRLGIVAAAALLIGMTSRPYPIENTTIVGVAVLLVTGGTFLGHFLFSLGMGKESLRQKFSIWGLMKVTAVAAGMSVALRYGVNYDELEDAGFRAAMILFHLVMLETVLVTQCSVWWARTWGMFCGMIGVAVATAIGAPLMDFAIHSSLEKTIVPLEQLIKFHGFAVACIWISLVPLQLALKFAGTSLVRESWMEQERVWQHHEADLSPQVGGALDE
ncbi:hypothetical protein [Blastopirellula marina]|uniref:Uncharacterized protein n=1 Tax=Blastopirellula marina TaxID=124 RepID=A0A2S8GP25_9BACT|nr:hypothetical protein [Blastopirellula marina]PQO46180.1 hypothetical protein C5Y93_09320 [Blastopirellula marina]